MFFHVGKGATCSMLIVRSTPSREARFRHRSAAQKSTAETSTRDGMRWKRRSKRIQIFAFEPRGWERGPHATRAYVAGGFGKGGTRIAWV